MPMSGQQTSNKSLLVSHSPSAATIDTVEASRAGSNRTSAIDVSTTTTDRLNHVAMSRTASSLNQARNCE